MRPYEYEQIDLSTDGIRLVRLYKVAAESIISCDIFEAFLDEIEGVPYEALSYTWGARSSLHEIQVNGTTSLNINKNLHVALQNLRLPDRDRILWVDGICINQEDDREKGHQVRQMRLIYQKADRVIIWLGESTPEIDSLMQLMNHFDKQVTTKRYGYISSRQPWELEWPDLLGAYGGSEANFYLKPYNGMKQLLQSPWFERVWIIQEVASAKQAIVACGSKSASARVFSLLPSLMGLDVGSHTQAMLDIMPGPMRKSSWWNGERDLYTLLKYFSNSKSSDPRDKIYALLGISSDMPESADLLPNYHLPLGRAIEATISFIVFREVLDPERYTLPEYTLDEFLNALDNIEANLMMRASVYTCSEVLTPLIDEGWKIMTGTPDNIRENKNNNMSDFPFLILMHRDYHEVIETILKAYDSYFNSLKGESQDEVVPMSLEVSDEDKEVAKFLFALRRSKLQYASRYEAYWRKTPLNFAISKGDEKTVKLILAHKGTDLNLEDWEDSRMTPLGTAISAGRLDLAELILAHPDTEIDSRCGPESYPVLWYAAKDGNKPGVELLVGKGAALDGPNYKENSPLYVAIQYRHADVAEFLLQNSANVNYAAASTSIFEQESDGPVFKNVPALSLAAGSGQTNTTRHLLERGAGLEVKDSQGCTPLSFAAEYGHTEIVKILLDHGADIESHSDQGTPLCVAAIAGHLDTARYLLDRGAFAAVHITNQDSSDSLLWNEVAEGSADMARLFIERGHNANAKGSPELITPLEIAVKNGHPEMAEVLRTDITRPTFSFKSALL